MNKKIKNSLESFVVVVILLVLVQTFLEDFAVLVKWPYDYRRILIITGFGFDLFFTIEFLTRFYFALLKGRAGEYIRYQRGWIDFLASVPLLLLNSGPLMFAMAAGGATIAGMGGILNVLKVVKAVRIARILRLLRVLKIFKQIKYTNSVMAQRHVAKITSLAVTVFVLSIFVITLLFSFIGVSGLDSETQKAQIQSFTFIRDHRNELVDNEAIMNDYLNAQPWVLLVRYGGDSYFNRYDNEYFDTYYGPGDYGYLQDGKLEVFYDFRPLNAAQSKESLIYFIIIIILVIAYLTYYSPHFAITVSDPIHIMRRGMQEKGYNLEVKIPDEYGEDEVYRLASLYNEVYLPLKDRSGGEEDGGVLDLKMEDIQDILDQEE